METTTPEEKEEIVEEDEGDVDAEATELVDGKVVPGAGIPVDGAKKGLKAVGGAVVGGKKKTRRTKWVATGEEVVEAFEAITRVKFESPTRLMGEFGFFCWAIESEGIRERV